MFKEIFSIEDDLDSAFQIDFDEERDIFRITYFEGNHFVDECYVKKEVFEKCLELL